MDLGSGLCFQTTVTEKLLWSTRQRAADARARFPMDSSKTWTPSMASTESVAHTEVRYQRRIGRPPSPPHSSSWRTGNRHRPFSRLRIRKKNHAYEAHMFIENFVEEIPPPSPLSINSPPPPAVEAIYFVMEEPEEALDIHVGRSPVSAAISVPHCIHADVQPPSMPSHRATSHSDPCNTANNHQQMVEQRPEPVTATSDIRDVNGTRMSVHPEENKRSRHRRRRRRYLANLAATQEHC